MWDNNNEQDQYLVKGNIRLDIFLSNLIISSNLV